MKFDTMAILAAGFLALVGCERLDQVVNLGHKAQDETRREHERQTRELHAEERAASLRAERDALTALINGKLVVLSNRVAEAEAAILALQADRTAFSKELGIVMRGNRDINGVGLERALASPAINEIAMKYLHVDFAVARGEYAEAIAQARASETEYRTALRKIDQTFCEQIELNPQRRPAERRTRAIADLKREHDQLDRKRIRLARVTIPTGNVYHNQRNEHDREMRNIELRLREIEHMIDQLKAGDERGRREADQIAKSARERSLAERNKAAEKLKQEYGMKMTVLKTIELYTDRTLHQLERALVKESLSLDEKKVKAREGYLTVQEIRDSIPKLTSDGIRKIQGQIMAF